MNLPEPLIHENGCPYYKVLPRNIRVAKIFDFITIDPENPDGYEVNMDMPYILEGATGIFWLKKVTPILRDTTILPFIEAHKCFVFV